METKTMKKLMTIALMLLACLTAGAQGKWEIGMTKADDLKGMKAEPYHLYEVEVEGYFVVWDWDDWAFKFGTRKGTFDVWYYNTTANRFVEPIIGLYSLDGKLIEKFEDQLQADHIKMNAAWINKNWAYRSAQKKKIKRFLHALKSGEGYIRIICKRRGAPEFDFIVPPYKL